MRRGGRRTRPGQDVDGTGEIARGDRRLQPVERQRRRLDEAVEEKDRTLPRRLGAAQHLEPFLVFREALAQARPEDLLQLRKAAVAEGLREANERRRLHRGVLGDLGHRPERHVLRPFESERRDLLQALGQGIAAADQELAQTFEIVRRRAARLRGLPGHGSLPSKHYCKNA